MDQHKPSVTSAYASKLAIAAIVLALVSALSVIAYMGGAGSSTVQISASPDGGTGSADSTAANFRDVPVDDTSGQARAILVDSPAPTLIISTEGDTAPTDGASARDGDDSPAIDVGTTPNNETQGSESSAPADAPAGTDASINGTGGATDTGNDNAGRDAVETLPPVCPGGSAPVGNGCVIVGCTYGYTYNGTECEPLCTGNTVWDGTECQPISIRCIPGLVWNGNKCVMVCEGNTSWNGSECAGPQRECPPGTTLEGDECPPICHGEAVWVGTGCVVVDCIHGLIFNGTGCVPATWECGPGGVPTQWGCSPLDCGAGYVLVGGACHTPCNDNRVLAGDDCVEVLCATGFTWTGTHCLPDGPACPHGQVIVNGRCTQLGFEDVAGVDLQVRPELLNPELDLSQTIPVLPLFPNN